MIDALPRPYLSACGLHVLKHLWCMFLMKYFARFVDALARYEEALAIEVCVHGENKTVGVADTLCNLASVLYNLERYQESLQKYHEALTITKNALGEICITA